MGSIENWLIAHASNAHWFAFGAIILAGFCVPISIDLVLIICAYIAATILPEHTYQLFFSILISACLSAWIAYWMGRTLGRRLTTLPLLSKMLPEARLQRWKLFYEKYGFWTLVFGRFIPFGVRNILFVSTGMSRMSFPQFALRDSIAAALWATSLFSLIYFLGTSMETIQEHFGIVRNCLLIVLAIAGIAFFWYKRKKSLQKKKQSENADPF